MHRQPVVYEVNTRVWLGEVSARLGSPVRLDTVPDDEWDALLPPGVDVVWLMGVWERSPFGRAVALDDPSLRASWDEALPGWSDADVLGSPYCVHRYAVDAALGGDIGLTTARIRLLARGIGLWLDLVPNHVAPDHPWVTEHPEAFVRGTEEDLAHDPAGFLAVGGTVVARGRDPYFPPWPDVVQLDVFSAAARQLTIDTLKAIAERADGVRCDMAMLLLDDVFARTWGQRVGPPRPQEFWAEVIAAVRVEHPQFTLVAEAYWDREPDLLRLGFDACYDKRLYDRLAGHDLDGVRAHLGAAVAYQERTVRFLENHDEPRAAATFGPVERQRACSVALATLPGTTLWHDGQLDGRRVRLPVFLARRPQEPLDPALREFHEALLTAAPSVRLAGGEWALCAVEGWPGNDGDRRLLAWTWTAGAQRSLVVVNLSDRTASAHVRLPWPDLAGRTVVLSDDLDGQVFERSGDDLAGFGLYVELPAWGYHVLQSDVSG
jgi:hypothetical protein